MYRGRIEVYVAAALIFSWDRAFRTEAAGLCGETKGCFAHPEDCNVNTPSEGCTAFFSWSLADNDTLLLNIQAFTDTYIAVGFSRSGRMDDAEVYACTSQLNVTRSRNDERSNIPLTLVGVSNQTVSSNDQLLQCSFKRSLSLPNVMDFYNLSRGNTYTPLLAWSGKLSEQGNLEQHEMSGRTFGQQEIDFTVIGSSGTPAPPSTEISTTDSGTRRRYEFIFVWIMALLMPNVII